jgi:hypothetical protein
MRSSNLKLTRLFCRGVLSRSWLPAALCAFMFCRASAAGQVKPPSITTQPTNQTAPVPATATFTVSAAGPPAPQATSFDEEARKKIEALIDQYLAPVAAVEPKAEVKTAIQKEVDQLRSEKQDERDAAVKALVARGTDALGVLRPRTLLKVEVPDRPRPGAPEPPPEAVAEMRRDRTSAELARSAIEQIEAAARKPIVDKIKSSSATYSIIAQQIKDAAKEADGFALMQEAARARGDAPASNALLARRDAAAQRGNALSALLKLMAAPVIAPLPPPPHVK